MKRHALSITLALTIALAPKAARADALDELATVLIVAIVVVGVGSAVVETVTGVATYKNYKSRSSTEDASGFWVGAGAIGGLANIGVGGAVILGSLPETHLMACPDPKGGGYLERFTATANPDLCNYHEPANKNGIVIGAILMGFGALAVGTAVSAATASKPTGNVGDQGQSHAASIPLLTF